MRERERERENVFSEMKPEKGNILKMVPSPGTNATKHFYLSFTIRHTKLERFLL
jgi:hypothetical protein